MNASTYTVHHALREDINEASVWIGDNAIARAA